jgi:hypothetical protein
VFDSSRQLVFQVVIVPLDTHQANVLDYRLYSKTILCAIKCT